MSDYIIHAPADGGLVIYRNANWDDLNHIRENYEVYRNDKDAYDTRRSWLEDKTPDQVDLPNEVGSNSDADITG